MIQIILSLVPLLIFSLIFYIRGFRVKNIIHLVFCGVMSLTLTLILGGVLKNIIPGLSLIAEYGNALSKFLAILIMTGLIEELSKYITLKMSNSKTKNEILINMIYIALIFTAFENYSYMGIASQPFKLGLFRMLAPGHEFFAIIMVYFLWKANDYRKENKHLKNVAFECLALVIPALAHTIFDYILKMFNVNLYNLNTINILILILLTIIGYGIPLYAIFKLKKEKIIDEKKSNKILKIFELIVITLYVLLNVLAFDPFGISDVRFKDTLIIEKNNIEITLNEVKEIEVNDSLFESDNGTYVKVNLTIKNRSNEKNSVLGFWNLINHKTSEKISSTFNYIGGEIDFEIPANSSVTGNIYFETKLKEDYKLEYSAQKFDKESLKIKEEKYRFLLK